MSYPQQTLNFINNPLELHSDQYHMQHLKFPKDDQNLQLTNTTTIVNRNFVHSEEDSLPTNNIKKIKPSLDAKPSKIPPCFLTASFNLHQQHKQILKIDNQDDDSTMSRTRLKKPKPKIISQPQEHKTSLSVIKQQPANEKPALHIHRSPSVITESAEISSSISPTSTLREKYAHLIPPIHRRTLSSEQHQLYRITELIDNAMTHLQARSSTKWIFFHLVKRNLRDTSKVFIDFKHLEQLLYLDDSLYEVKWEKNMEEKKYDIMMKLPEIKSRNERKEKLKAIMMEFLEKKQEEFLEARGIKDFNDTSDWHPGFKPHNYEIPRLPLPPHPETKQAEIRCLDDNKINAIKNEKVRELFKTQKEKTEIKSFTQQKQSSMDLIFSGMSAQAMEQRLVANVKAKEQAAKEKLEFERQYAQKEMSEVTPDTLREISQNLLKIYVSAANSPTSMAWATVLLKMKERTHNKFGEVAMDTHIKYLIERKELGFLSEIKTDKGMVILKMNRGKYQDVLRHVEDIRRKGKDEPMAIKEEGVV